MSEASKAEAELWAFSLDRYARPGVGGICLELQDTLGVDVNVALMCLWCAQRGGPLSADDIRKTIAAGAGAWHADVVGPLRAARRAAKPAASADNDIDVWRNKLKVLEIEAERHEQRMLVEAIESHVGEAPSSASASAAIAIENLTAYLQLVAPDQEPFPETRLKQLVDACID